MKRKQWSEKEKFEVVLEGLRGEVPISDICAKHEVHQSQYYAWREQFIENGAKVFAMKKQSQHEKVIENKMRRMQQVIGELTMELKKSD